MIDDIVIELEYQPEDGGLFIKDQRESPFETIDERRERKKPLRLMDFYGSLQKACEEVGPDNKYGQRFRLRVWSFVKRGPAIHESHKITQGPLGDECRNCWACICHSAELLPIPCGNDFAEDS